ncbi:MAG TPA: Ig-like domain-containing protein, partial [Puia sp.]|nr:Ig-like domain-containing protein [Puia sp.]
FGDKWYYDAISKIATQGLTVAQIQTTTNTEYTDATGKQQMVRYTSNHDIESNTTAFSVFQNHAGVVVNFLVSAYMRGVPFLTSGQEVDFNQTIPWPYTTVKINWTANPGAAADFTKILNYRTSSTAIRQGTMTNYSDANVCAFTKTSGTEKVVVMANLRNNTSNYTIPSALAGNYKDVYTGAAVTITSGATQTLSAFQYIVLTNANVATVPVTGVTVSPGTATVAAGLTTQLTATVAPANATNQAVSWTTSNAAVATVSGTGLVTGVAAGTAVITATTADGGKTATATVTVTAASSFTVNFYKPASWGSGIKIYWWAAQPAGVLADGSWPGVAMTNDNNGWYSYTFTNITSTNLIFNDGSNQTANLSRGSNGWYLSGLWYDTQPVPVTGIAVNPGSATVNAGATQQLSATIAPANATNQAVNWSSSNTAVATVGSSGLVTAVASGTATITATTQDGSFTANCAVTVPSTGTTYYQILNRWQPNTYLYDGGGGKVLYGTSPGGTSYQWTQVSAPNGYVYLQNRATGNYMFVENQTGYVQCGAIQSSWYSAMWGIADAGTGAGWDYIQNRWQPNQWVHIENLLGYAQYANAQTGWYSAMWQFVNPVTVSGAAPAEQSGIATVFARDSVLSAGVALYPNPAPGGRFFVSLPQTLGSVRVIVSDVNGRTVHEAVLAGSGWVSHVLAPGVYFVRIRMGKGDVIKKLLVE